MSNEQLQFKALDPEASTRVALLVEYCGASYSGNQFQPNQPTVQGELQLALSGLNLTTSAVSFASRTDAGVHARGQVAHFDVLPDGLANIPNLIEALNALLPGSVAVRDVCIGTSSGFHSRREARGKWYQYRIHNGASRTVWAGVNASHVREPLDVAKMAEAARLVTGEHNFKSFKASDTQSTDEVCRVAYFDVRCDGESVVIDIVADRFLYKMVRNLVGQLTLIGKTPELPARSILDVMAVRERQRAATSAPACGLTLMAVSYEEPHRYFARNAHVEILQTLIESNPMESKHHENLFRKAS